MTTRNPSYDSRGAKSSRGLTWIAIMVILAVIAMLAALILPALAKSHQKSARINCINNLKNVGRGFQIFATDNDGLFPWQVPIANGGTKEWVSDETQIWRHWHAVSNELSTPKIAVCPHDPRGGDVLGWGETNTTHISYFIGLNASETNPATILGGDRNVTIDGAEARPGRLVLGTRGVAGFSKAMHHEAGNILLGDGSVQQVTSARLNESVREALRISGVSSNTWLIP